jgi:hypothetical protein
MPSLRRILASRANGARSLGPVTPEGKARSSCNALRHGLLAKCVVLSNESPAGFQELHDQFVNRFGPADGVEDGLLEEMVAASWRLRRFGPSKPACSTMPWPPSLPAMNWAASPPPSAPSPHAPNSLSSIAMRPGSTTSTNAPLQLPPPAHLRRAKRTQRYSRGSRPGARRSASSAPPSSPPSCGVPAVPNEPNSSLPVPVLPPGS